MPRLPVSPAVDELLRRPSPATLSSVRPNGTPHVAAVWYLWDGARALLTFDRSRKRLEFLGANPGAALAVLDGDDWYRHVCLFGRVTDLWDDEGLDVADRLARHYLGRPYPDRTRPRVAGLMEIDTWYAWNAYERVPTLERGGVPVRGRERAG